MKRVVRHHDYLMKHLKNPTEASAYLNSVAQDGSLGFLLIALRNVVEAQGGISALAKKTGLARTTLYKTLSKNGNPEIYTLNVILKIYGLRIGFFSEEDRKAA